ncbi:transposase [Candidatus Finniella inopinata]|uniref:Transposase n=1 Tax=Candidatus Finniella inopinata TaxID=1696036 RepID=A0A4Q7DHR1_9PROT|nr:transposase [Candidatus Finniella inopinata]
MTTTHKKLIHSERSWALDEFGEVDCGDIRLTKRLVKIADDFVKSPESSINQASGSWAEAKAAYRFLQNDNVKESEILASHVKKTRERTKNYQTILSIQDTSYMSYKNHKKTTGLGVIASRVRSEKTNFKTPGLVMHTAFAVTTDGLPIGLLDQKIHSRPPLPAEIIAKKKRSHGRAVSIEDKESIRWLGRVIN